MTIRRLELADYDALFTLWQRAGLTSLKPNGRDSREAFAQQLASGVQTVLGLENDRQLIGAVVATHDGRKGWINRLVVDPAHRRQGHARRLIAAAEATLKAQGMHVIACLIEGWNETSLALFQGKGYVPGDVCYLSKRDSDKA
jgi:ribosomal protein S18 acetylase RimI-like enzyme